MAFDVRAVCTGFVYALNVATVGNLCNREDSWVANLHYGHRHHELHIERIRRSLGDHVVLVFDDGDQGNSIAFACKGLGLHQ